MGLLVKFAVKFWPYIAGFIVIGGAGLYIHHQGVLTGRYDIQQKFDAFVKASDARALAQIADNVAKKAAAEKTNAEVLTTLSGQRDRAISAGRRTADKLREYLAQASRSPVPQANDQSGTDDAAAERRIAELGQALGALRSECAQNADQLSALQAELGPQL